MGHTLVSRDTIRHGKRLKWRLTMGNLEDKGEVMKKLLLLAILVISGCSNYPSSMVTISTPESEVLGDTKSQAMDVLNCVLVRVIDGDTIIVKFYVWSDIILEKYIRFDDIDTWEMRGPNKEKGKAAKEFLKELLASGDVILHTKRKKGKYGRLLGSIHVRKDGVVKSSSQELRENGHEKVTE